MTTHLRVLVVDPERAFAEGLALYFGATRRWRARGAVCAVEAMHELDEEQADVLVVAVGTGASGIGDIHQLSREHPRARIVLLTSPGTPTDLRPLVRAGGRGWTHKGESLERVAAVVEQVALGEWWLPRGLLGDLVEELTSGPGTPAGARLSMLTTRERQVLQAMVEGLPRAEIAARLRMSVNTLRTHVQHMLTKLEVHTSLEAVALALRHDPAALRPARPLTACDRVAPVVA